MMNSRKKDERNGMEDNTPFHPNLWERGDGGADFGIYLVRVDACRASEGEGVCMEVDWKLRIIAPVKPGGTIEIHNDLRCVEQFEELQRQLAVLGVELTAWLDLTDTCPRAEGKCVYVEVLPTVYEDDFRMQFLDLAKNFRLAYPNPWNETRAEAEARFVQIGHPLEFHRMGDRFPDYTEQYVSESTDK